MADAHQNWRVLVYRTYAATALVADLSGRWVGARISSALHGGFKEGQFSVPMTLAEAWTWLNTEGARGRHYYHLEVTDAGRKVWEGRIVDIGLRTDPSFIGVDITALGYWSSMRDRYYDPDDAGNTDWKVGGPHNVGKIIREVVTKSCPDINGTAGIDLTTRDVAGIDLTARAYPQDIILDKLAPLSDAGGTAVYYFAVWDDRKPYWKARTGTAVNWQVWLSEIKSLRLVQQGKHLRNRVLPVVGTAEGTVASNAESTGAYVVREMMLSLPAGVPTTAANDARDAALQERKDPVQDENFSISGRIYATKAFTPVGTWGTAGTSAGVDMPKWWVRAGDVVRIQDLVPASVATGKLDNLRTFYILETSYDAGQNMLTVQPDRSFGRLDVLLARSGTLERNK